MSKEVMAECLEEAIELVITLKERDKNENFVIRLT